MIAQEETDCNCKERKVITMKKCKITVLKTTLDEELAKEYGILYMIAHPKGKAGDTVDVISTQRYAAKLNAVYQAMGYPLPEEKTAEAESAKKVQARDPQESVSPERGSGWKAETRETSERGKVPVREKLKALEKTAKELEQRAPVPGKEPVR